jgi:hypothetical protein
MTRTIIDWMENIFASDIIHLLKFVTGGLLFQKGVRDEQPLDGVDVEELFAAILLLAERETLEAAPFVGSWHPLVDRFDRAKPGTEHYSRINRAIREIAASEMSQAFPDMDVGIPTSGIDRAAQELAQDIIDFVERGGGRIDSTLGPAIGQLVAGLLTKWRDNLRMPQLSEHSHFNHQLSNLIDEAWRSGEGEIYRRTADLMIKALLRIAWLDSDERVRYLAPVINLLASQKRLVVGTLNYDNTVELAAAAAGRPCNTGMSGWSSRGILDAQGDGLHLLKLHGSLNWSSEPAQNSGDAPMPHAEIRELSPKEMEHSFHRPAVIFGSRNKLTADGPFLEVLRTFQSALLEADRLTVVGYSFRDPHINVYISQWLNQGRQRRLRIIDPGFEDNKVNYARQLRESARSRLEIIPETAEIALAAAFPEAQADSWHESVSILAQPSQPNPGGSA